MSAEKPRHAKIFQFITGHRTGGIPGTNGGHPVRIRPDEYRTAGAANHFLRQRVASRPLSRHCLARTEYVAVRRPSASRAFVVRLRPMISGIMAAGADFINQHIGFSPKSPAVRWFRGYALRL